jgi:hypothetical protein
MPEYAQKTRTSAPPAAGATRVARSQAQLRSAASIGGGAAAGQQPLQAALNQAPVVQAVAQLKRALNQSSRVGQVAQLSSVLQETHRDVAQGKFDTVQRVEEEEMLQGKFATAQRLAEEEEPLQGKFETVQRVEEEEMLQGKFATAQRLAEEEEPLQGKFQTVQREAAADAPNRTGMPDNLKAGIESLSGMDMSGIRVHRNSDSPAGLDALAYAQGNDIHLGPGQDHHLPHEAWHVVQQRQGRVAPTMQLQGVSINDDHGLEAEADRMGTRASQLKKDAGGRGRA